MGNKLLILLISCTILPYWIREDTYGRTKSGQFVLVIDPGHGGKDTGALGSYSKEKDINLSVALLVGKYISMKNPDVKIVYTRKSDVFIGLKERANLANRINADLFISIHSNSSLSRSPSGVETYVFGMSSTEDNLEVAKRENSVILLEDNYKEKYQGFNPNSSESYIMFEFMQNRFHERSINFASDVERDIVKETGRDNRGVRQAPYWVIRKTAMPSILIELEFISNLEGENFLNSNDAQIEYAKGIAEAFNKFKIKSDKESGEGGKVIKSGTEKDSEKINLENSDHTNVPSKAGRHGNQRPDTNSGSELENDSDRIVYKVQIYSSLKKLPLSSSVFRGYEVDFYHEGGRYKYTYGASSNWNKILEVRRSVLKDFSDAFVVKFRNGKRVVND